MHPPLRITFLDSWNPRPVQGSGTAVGIAGLQRALELLGHRVEVVRPLRDGATLADRLRFNLSLPARIRSRREPDLVVGFDVDGFRWARQRGRRAPYIVSLKGIAADEARFARSYRERAVLQVLARLERRNALGADQVLVPSRYSKRVAEDRYRIPPERIWVLPEAVDLRGWAELRTRHGGKRARNVRRPPTILSVARQYPRKDTPTLLHAMRIVVDRQPGVRLIVIGGGPELPHLRRLSEGLGLEGNVCFRGPVAEDQEVRDAYFEADLFSLPSKQEGFGIVFVEAMAAGLPIVAASAGATPEVVEHERTGLLVPPSAPRALASAMMRLLASPADRKRLGEAGIRSAEEYGLEAIGHRFMDRIEFLIGAPARKRSAGHSGSRSGQGSGC